jgi:cysteine-rich repeat protein
MSRLRVKRTCTAAILLGAAVLPPAACGGDDDTNDPRPTGGSSTTTTGTAGGGGAGGEAGGGAGGGTCGNGVAEPGELCDGDDVRGRSCQDLGFDTGEARCTANCTFDTSGCSGTETCQDGRDNDGDGDADCNDPGCAAACADPCATPEILPDPANVSGETRGHAVFQTLCADPPGGPAAVYEFTATTTGFLDVIATAQTERDIIVSVRTSCADVAAELTCDNSAVGSGVDDFVSLPITAGETVYIVVSGADENQTSAFALVARSRSTICGDGIQDPSEECDVISPGPNDGCSDDCHFDLTEVEPNGTAGTANVYAAPYFGAVQPAGDQDVIRVTVPSGPTTLTAETSSITSAACVNNQLDSAVDILDSAGTVLVSNDNSGPGLCAQAVAPSLAAGTYYVRVRAPALTITPTFGYRLDLTLVAEVCGDGNVAPAEQCDDGNTAAGDGCSPTCRFELTEAEPNNAPAQANAYADPLLAEIAPAGDVDVIAIDVPGPSSTLSVAVGDRGTGTCEAGLLDSYLEILDTDGARVLASDEDTGLGNCSYASAAGLPAGTYFARVRASDLSPSTTFFYLLTVTLP